MPGMSAETIKIREYRPEDVAHLHRIDQLCFPADIAFSKRELFYYLSNPGSITKVAEVSGNIVGFVLGRIQLDRLAHILTLDVVREARRNRIGTLLMESLHEVFRNRAVLLSVLEVSTKNLAALRLYEALNYQLLETLRGYYRGREDAYRMVCHF